MTTVTKTTDFGDRTIYAYTETKPTKPSDYTVGDRVTYRSPIYPEGLAATVAEIGESFVHIRFDRDPVGNKYAAYPENLTKVSPPAVSESESLLRRALQAVNRAKRFKFAVDDDSYRLASDIERYLKATTGKNPYTGQVLDDLDKIAVIVDALDQTIPNT